MFPDCVSKRDSHVKLATTAASTTMTDASHSPATTTVSSVHSLENDEDVENFDEVYNEGSKITKRAKALDPEEDDYYYEDDVEERNNPTNEATVVPPGFLSPSVREYLDLGKSIPGKIIFTNFQATKTFSHYVLGHFIYCLWLHTLKFLKVEFLLNRAIKLPKFRKRRRSYHLNWILSN